MEQVQAQLQEVQEEEQGQESQQGRELQLGQESQQALAEERVRVVLVEVEALVEVLEQV
jgi:hypothetical protein